MQESKKSETIEVRVPHDRKSVFMAHCRATGRTASMVIRDLIENEMNPKPARSSKNKWQGSTPLLCGGVIAILLVGLSLAAPSAKTVAAAPDFRPVFESFDHNHDGVLDAGEYGNRVAMGPTCGSNVFVIPLPRAATPDVRGMRGFAVLKADFALRTIDWNRDGRITFDEYAANWTHLLRKGFVSLDVDGNGTINRVEYRQAADHHYQKGTKLPDIAPFKELDNDKDGRVSWSEFTT